MALTPASAVALAASQPAQAGLPVLHSLLQGQRSSMVPGDTTAAFNVGVALEDLGATVDATTAYRRALECDPRNPDAHYNLARLLEQDGKPDLAIRHLLLYRQLTKKR